METEKPKQIEINLSKCSGYVDNQEITIIRNSLDKTNLYSDQFLYTVLKGNKKGCLKEVEKYANALNSIYALQKQELLWENESDSANSLRELLRVYNLPILAVWDKNEFIDYGGYIYKFKNPDKKLEALVGIGKIRLSTS